VDFLCAEVRLIVEIDGGHHSAARDAARSAFLENEGYRILRFWNHEVLDDPESVLQAIGNMLRP